MDTTPYYLAAPATDVEFLQVEEVPTLVRKVRDQPMDRLAEVFDTAYTAVMEHAEGMGVSLTGPAFALYTSMPTNVVSMEAGIPVDRPIDQPSTTEDGLAIEPSVLPGGNIARMTYFGGYDGLPDAWRTFMQALTATGKQPDLPFWELYISEPGPDVDPATLRTDLVTKVRS